VRIRRAISSWLACGLLLAAAATGGELPRGASTALLRLEVPVFVGGYGIAFFEETARKFEAQRPGVAVHLHGDPRIADKVRIRVIEGRPPDATDANLLWPALIEAGRVLDLTPYLDGPNWENDARWRDTFVPGALERWSREGRTYGLPFAYAAWTIFYNRAQFRAAGQDEPPRTWEEFFALCERLRAQGVAPLAFPGVYSRYGDAFVRAAHYNLAGPEAYEALTRLAPGAFSTPEYVRAVDVLRRLGTEHFLEGWQGMTHTAAQLAFVQGRAAMAVAGSWFVNEMRGRIPPGFDLGTMNFPVFPEGVGHPAALQTSSAYYFLFATGDAARERATVDFFRFLTSRERALAFARQVDSPTAVRGVPREAFSPALQETAALIEASPASYGLPPDSPAFIALVNQTMTDSRLLLLRGQITAEEFGARLEAAAAAERARLAEPDRVQVNHAGKAALLLGALAAGVGVLAWRAVRRRRAWGPPLPSTRAMAPTGGEAWLGRLRAPMAAVFVGPAFALYAGLVLVPGLLSFAWALTRWDGIGDRTWAGLFNFRWLLLESDVFWAALGNNLFLMVVPTLVVVPLALFFAALFSRGVRGAGFFRACFLFPNLLGGVAATLLWLNAYDPANGLVNAALVRLGGVVSAMGLETWGAWLEGFRSFAWLAPERLYASLVPIYIWMACGFNLVLYLAAMEGVDRELYEAAELDGASPLRQFFGITLPLIWDVIAISAVFIVIGGLNTFELIWLLTAQEPASGSHVLGTWMVGTLFREFQIGRATAIAVMLFLLVLAGTALVRHALHREAIER
jgi:ABC-type sugar transport system permease subunit/ABC-type glycerol-3-phosphate transport system substrate-binding protein